MYIGMPYDRDKNEIPAFGLFIEKPYRFSNEGIQVELFAFRRPNAPEAEHCHRVVLTFGCYLNRFTWVNWRRRKWIPFFNLILIPAWWDEPTARAHYRDKGQRWHG